MQICGLQLALKKRIGSFKDPFLTPWMTTVDCTLTRPPWHLELHEVQAFPNYCRWTSPHLRFPKGTSTLALHTTSGFCVVCCSTLESRHHWFAWLSWPCLLHVKAAQMQVIEVNLQTAISLGSTLVLCEHLTSGEPPVLICPFSGTAFLSLQVQGTSVSLLSRSDAGQEGLPSYFSYLCSTIYENVDHFRITWVNHFCKMLLGEFVN